MSDAVTFRLEDDLMARLEQSAVQRGVSKSELVRQSIIAFLEQDGVRKAHAMLKLAGTIRGRGMSATNANIRSAIRRKVK